MGWRKWGAATLLVVGGVVGVALWGGFQGALAATNTSEFCISCHEMKDTVYADYIKTPHFKNASGVRAECADCHVPRELGPKLMRKLMAANDLYHHLLGTIDTPEKFEARRPVLTERVWSYMKATDSRECRHCHSYEAMDFHKQTERGREKMQESQKKGETCIECHQGVAHSLPKRDD
ncbi:NapC/NirT family cytochrome c [Ideonella sp. A 288]|uniref:NapC/NirT family cytochrome c n=1 Tax=Ideonella sp. A 288 TaxID=1962181 RepID=UPI000B4A8003|nr:NapC/NirT family cytochrome c [Ideonella sp. A 288]